MMASLQPWFVFSFMLCFRIIYAENVPVVTSPLRFRGSEAWSNSTNQSHPFLVSHRTTAENIATLPLDLSSLAVSSSGNHNTSSFGAPSSSFIINSPDSSSAITGDHAPPPDMSNSPASSSAIKTEHAPPPDVSSSRITTNMLSTASKSTSRGTGSWLAIFDESKSWHPSELDQAIPRSSYSSAGTSSAPPSTTILPSLTAGISLAPSITVLQSTSKIAVSPVPISTGIYAGLTQFWEFPGFSVSRTTTISGVTTNVATKTRGNDNKETPLVIFFPCILFCGGGGGGGGGSGGDFHGFGMLFNIGPLPGIYHPPNLPPFVIGSNGIPTPNPPDLPARLTNEPEKPEKQSEKPPQITTPPATLSTSLSSSSSCSVRTASACSEVCNKGSCTTTCSPVATACSATCMGTTCSQAATKKFPSWHTMPTPEKWQRIKDYNETRAREVAQAINSLVISWEMEVAFMDGTNTSPVLSTTLVTLAQSSSSSSASSLSVVTTTNSPSTTPFLTSKASLPFWINPQFFSLFRHPPQRSPEPAIASTSTVRIYDPVGLPGLHRGGQVA